MKKLLKILLGVVVSATALFALSLIILVNLDFNDYKYVVETKVQEATGRNFEIRGPLDLDISMTPTLLMEDVVLKNASWVGAHSPSNMLTLGRLEAKVDLSQFIFAQKIDVHNFVLSDVSLDLVSDGAGRYNFDFAPYQQQSHDAYFNSEKETSMTGGQADIVVPILRHVELSNITISYMDPNYSGIETFKLERLLLADQGETSGMALSVKAMAGPHPLSIDGKLGSITELLDADKQWPVDIEADIAPMHLSVSGNIKNPLDISGVDLKLAGEIPSVKELADLLSMKLPASNLGAVRFFTNLSGSIEDKLSLSDLRASLIKGNVYDIRVKGGVEDALSQRGIDFALNASMNDVSKLSTIAGLDIPALGKANLTLKGMGNITDEMSITGVEFSLEKGDALEFALSGGIDNLFTQAGMHLNYDLALADLKILDQVVQQELPALRQIKSSGMIKGDLEKNIQLNGFTLKVGQSDLAGDVDVTFEGAKPKLIAKLQSNEIHKVDFAPVTSTTSPEVPQTKSSSPTQEAVLDDQKVIPNTDIPLEGLKAINADINLDIGRIKADEVSLSPVALALRLNEGVLNVEEFSLGDGIGGALKGSMLLDGRKDEAITDVKISSAKFNLGPVLSVAGLNDLLSGNMQIDIDLKSKGKTVRNIAAGLDGHFQTVLVNARLNSNALEKHFGKDAKALTDLLSGSGKDYVKVHCMLADYSLKKGLVNTENMMFDSEVSTITSTGTIDLNTEKLDLVVKPRGEVLGIGAAIPVLVYGDFNAPSFVPDPKGALAIFGGAVMAGVAWPVALAGAVVLSDDGKVPCRGREVNEAPAVKQEATSPPKIEDVGKKVLEGVLNNLFGN